ncbi:hypothetical protein OAU50_06350 [Planctomycetota bacterium]|nr:hypothetical protein [Planctomycetota bacterium]
MRCAILMAVLFAIPLTANETVVDTTLGDAGLTSETGDGNWRINMTTAVQARWLYHDTRGSNDQDGMDFNVFRTPVVRGFFNGHIFDRELQYSFWLAFGGPANGFRIENAYLRYRPYQWLNITAGQMRVDTAWEYLVDHEKQVLVDRAIADEAFHDGWGKGIEVSGRIDLYEANYQHAFLRYSVGVFNGVKATQTPAQGVGVLNVGTGDVAPQVTDAFSTEHFAGGFRNSDDVPLSNSFNAQVDADLMFAGRVEFHPHGEVERHMVDSLQDPDTGNWRSMIAVGVTWFETWTSGFGTFYDNFYFAPTTPTAPTGSGRERIRASITHLTLDGHFRWVGLSVNWAVHLRRTEFEATGSFSTLNLEDDSFTANGISDSGFLIDVGYFVTEEIVLSTRYSTVDFDEFKSRDSSGNPVVADSMGADSSEVGGGGAWMIYGDNLKVQADYRYVTQQLPFGRSSTASKASNARISDYRSFHEIRIQLQWIF